LAQASVNKGCCFLSPRPFQVKLAVMGCTSAKATEVKTYKGFKEHAYRLVFPFEDKFQDLKPDLLTILPTGVIENSKKLEPEKERGLIAYSFVQSVTADVAQKTVGSAESGYNNKPYSETPFVTKKGNKFALVQTWPTRFNAKFKQDFECKEENTDKKHFEPAAVQDFKKCVDSMFGQGATDKCKIQHCHKVTTNNNACYVGLTEALKDYLQNNEDKMKEVGIEKFTAEGFQSFGKDGKDNAVSKPFKMEKKIKYVIYKKVGWETMGCCKPLPQFLKECEFLEQDK